jgi:hypothetical protein
VIFCLGCFVVFILSIVPIFSSRPSKRAVRRWEASYSSILPPGYSDFLGHWQSQDIGVQIFSFHLPDGAKCEDVLSVFIKRIDKYRLHERVPGEVALRRRVTYSDPNGFDEYRLVCVPATHRVYGMFANLDDEMEVHSKLVEHFHKIARGQPE